jgi:hypothetical protein
MADEARELGAIMEKYRVGEVAEVADAPARVARPAPETERRSAQRPWANSPASRGAARVASLRRPPPAAPRGNSEWQDF